MLRISPQLRVFGIGTLMDTTSNLLGDKKFTACLLVFSTNNSMSYIAGSSLTKTVYRSKQDFSNGKPINKEVSWAMMMFSVGEGTKDMPL